MTLSLRYSAISDVGRVRKNNQDSGYAGKHLLVVADGMGGAPAGDVASAAAVQTLRRLDDATPQDVLEALASAIQRANERISELVEDDPRIDGMGTTLTAALFDGNHLGLAHIGDSRAYLLRDGELSQLTADHTFVQTLIDEGTLSAEEARSHPHRSLMLRVLDGKGDSDPDLTVYEMQPGDRLLLCSDGLPGFVDDESIAKVMADGTPDSVAVELVQVALAAGSSDNITCVVADVVDDAPTDVDSLDMLLVGAAAEQPRGPMGDDEGFALADTGELPAVPGVDPEELRYAPRPPRRFRLLRRLAIVAVLVAVAYFGGRLAYDWSQRQYYVGVSGERVAIYRGVEAEVPGVSLSHVYEPQDLSLAELPEYARERVASGIETSDLDDARSTVSELRNLAASCADTAPPTVGTTATPTTPTTPTTVRTRSSPTATPTRRTPAAPTPTRTTAPSTAPSLVTATTPSPEPAAGCAGASPAATP